MAADQGTLPAARPGAWEQTSLGLRFYASEAAFADLITARSVPEREPTRVEVGA